MYNNMYSLSFYFGFIDLAEQLGIFDYFSLSYIKK